MSTLRLVIIGIVLQVASLALAGCTARDGSPVRVDEDGLAAGLWRDLAAADAAGRQQLLGREVVEFAGTLDRLEAARQELVLTALRAAAIEDGGAPMTGAAVDDLLRAFAASLAAARETAAVAARHYPWVVADADACAAHGVAPLPEDLRREGSALCAAAALALYDGWLEARAAIAMHPGVRRVLNRGDSAYGVTADQIDGLASDYLSLRRRIGTHRAIAYLDAAGPAWLACDETHCVWLRGRIAASGSWRTLHDGWLVPVGEFVDEVDALIGSDRKRIGDVAMGRASQGFGNAVGAVAFRKGRLWGDAVAEAALRAELRPGDILLEKTPFRLTDRFIPGHWGHVAVWVGGEAELRALGMWDEPLVQAHAKDLAAGSGIVEALRDGVQLNPVAHFLDIDDVLVLRRPGLGGADLAEHLRRALRQLGKAYDFNFDVETADRIVCSELVYRVFTGLDWPTGQSLGRWTISPDQVAIRALPGGPLTVVDLWHDGHRIEGDRTAALADLLKPAR